MCLVSRVSCESSNVQNDCCSILVDLHVKITYQLYGLPEKLVVETIGFGGDHLLLRGRDDDPRPALPLAHADTSGSPLSDDIGVFERRSDHRLQTRQSSLNASEIGADAEDWESGIVIIVPPRIRRSTSQGSDAFPAMNKPNENDPGSTSEKVQGDSKELIHTTGADLERGADCDGPMTAYTCNDNGKPRTVIVFQVTNWNEERGEGSNNIEKTENESSHLQKDENVSSYLPEDLNESNETDVREAQGDVRLPPHAASEGSDRSVQQEQRPSHHQASIGEAQVERRRWRQRNGSADGASGESRFLCLSRLPIGKL
ncbi:unnamed protein product [Nesidiocoris tenuis]|uniref:Uncharacterized protein n=1 Tax=Nesidiocoris tenuis TaxID=355587 RepID=A0A6H5GGX7_9HEMI|nr:unnamed protein product [Nesidiocoris tenuis]